MSEKTIDNDLDFGYGVSFEELPDTIDEIEIEVTKRGKIKLTPEQEEMIQEELGFAIIDKDLNKVKELIASGAQANKKISGERISEVVIRNFDESVANYLKDNKMPLQYVDKLLRLSIDMENIDAIKWIVKNDKYFKGSLNDNTWKSLFDYSISKRKVAVTEYFLKNGPNGKHVNLNISAYRYFGSNAIQDYKLSHLINYCINKSNDTLLDALLKHIDVNSDNIRREMPKNEPYHGFDIYDNFFRIWLSHYGSKITYKNALFIQNFIQKYPEHKDTWDDAFPFYYKKYIRALKEQFLSDEEINKINREPRAHTKSLFIKNFVSWLILNASPAVSKISSSPSGEKAISKTLKDPLNLSIFLVNSNRSLLKQILSEHKEFFSSWEDDNGNGIGHYVISQSPTKSSCEDLYSINKDWLEKENNDGKSPIVVLPSNVQSHVNKKIIKKNLNDLKIGLIHNRGKTKRKM